MKLIKKLLPIATGLSTVAITAPIVASCGNSLNMDLNYSPTVSQHKEESFNTSENVLFEYFNQAKNNPEIIIQDYIFDCASFLSEWKENKTDNYKNKVVKYYASVSNLSLNKKSNIKSKDLYAISGTFVFNYSKSYSVDAKTESGDEYTSEISSNINTTLHITDLTLNIRQETEQEKSWWNLYLSSDNSLDWELREISTTKTSQKTTFKKDNKTLTSGTNFSDESIFNKSTRSVSWVVSWNSYYLKNVALKTKQ